MPTEVADGKISGKGGCPKYPTASLALRDEAKTCDGISKKLQNHPKTKSCLCASEGIMYPVLNYRPMLCFVLKKELDIGAQTKS